MGAKGGVIRVRVWKCPTCGGLFEQRDGGRKTAVRCCNEAMAKAEAKRDEARTRRSLSEVLKPTARFERDNMRRTSAVATAKCPKCSEVRTVRVPLEGFYGGKRTKKDAAKKAAALAVAGIGKHLRSRWVHGR
jgi:ssDNA-binding Zn-finger/Zn-ribbon topoisomerase 1